MKILATVATFLSLLGLSQAQLPPGVAPEIGILLTTVGALDLELVKFETPITLRFTNYLTIVFWNCVAVYDDTFLAADTNARPAVPSLDPSTFNSANRAVCAAQAAVTYSAFSFPGAVDGTVAALDGVGVMVESELDAAIAACDTSDPATLTTCLETVASDGNYNPLIMGQIVAFTAYLASLEDGWNQLGTLKPNGIACSYNCRNYTDPTGFAPVNSPYDSSSFNGNSDDRWQPLLEDNGRGFFYYQEHVTPHIGQTAAFRYLPEAERTTRVAPVPTYTSNRRQEMRAVTQRMAALDDTKKMQIEAFDNKLLIANSVFGAFLGKVLADSYVDTELAQPGLVLSYERLVHFIAGYIATEYDAVIIAWKEKVNYDLIRPTSTIKRWQGGLRQITTWVPFAGTQTINSADFEAYIRVMPHSEYVSGSSCLFEGVKDYVNGYLTEIGLSTSSFVVNIGLNNGPFPAGSSSVEPGLTPASPLLLTYPTIDSMALAGGESRLDGGMHFGEAVPAGEQLCSGIASYTIPGIFGLLGP